MFSLECNKRRRGWRGEEGRGKGEEEDPPDNTRLIGLKCARGQSQSLEQDHEQGIETGIFEVSHPQMLISGTRDIPD